MIRRWSIAIPLIVWCVGTLTTTRTSTSVNVMAFTPIPPTASTTSFYTTQNQQQQQQNYPHPPLIPSVDTPNHPQHVSSSSTSLDGTAPSMMSPWNINPEFGAPPFGFDMNAEIWNGRIAQVGIISFTILKCAVIFESGSVNCTSSQFSLPLRLLHARFHLSGYSYKNSFKERVSFKA